MSIDTRRVDLKFVVWRYEKDTPADEQPWIVSIHIDGEATQDPPCFATWDEAIEFLRSGAALAYAAEEARERDSGDTAAPARNDDLRAALDHVREHGFGDSVDDDEIIELAAQDHLATLEKEPHCNHDAAAVHNGRCECGAEIWYCWRVPVAFDGAPPRLVIPRGDPHLYEQPADLLHVTIAEARAWYDEELASWEEESELAYMGTWVLCKETLEVVR